MIVFGIIIFTLLSAIFSGTEIAFVTANRVGIEIERNKKTLKAKILNSFYDNPKEFIGVLLVGNNITIIVLTYLCSRLLDPFLNGYVNGYYFVLLIKTMMIATFALIFAEFIPKAIFKAYANDAIMKLSVPLFLMQILLKAPTLLFTALSSFLLKYIFRTKIIDTNVPLTRLDLEHFIAENITEEHDIEKDMFQKALNLDQVKARDVMVPRPEIVAIDKNALKADLVELLQTTKHSRVILIDDDIENVIGYIHHQQLINEKFKYAGDHFMPISFIPETMNAKELLLKFIREKQNIAIVVDEYGGIAGLITLEDLTEEIFGEIEDEYDIDNEDFFDKYLGENEYVFSGRLEIDFLNEKYDLLNLPQGEYNTLSGLIVNHLGEIPKRGLEFKFGEFNFRILKVSRNKIELVKVKKTPEL